MRNSADARTLRGWWTAGDTLREGGMQVAGGSVNQIVKRCCICALIVSLQVIVPAPCVAQSPVDRGGGQSGGAKGFVGSYARRQQAIAALPMHRLTRRAQQQILSIADSPTIYRRLPTQAIQCDREMFLFLTRHSEVLVGMWDLMGITNVTTKRTGPYQLEAEDGSGTRCQVDLVYGDANMHIFVAEGSYDGVLVAKPVRGKAVFILHSSYARSSSGGTTVTGSLDCFIQFEGLGADLIARTLSGLIGRSADNNFSETARFIGQVSQASKRNPTALIDIANRLPQVAESTKRSFAKAITSAAKESASKNPSSLGRSARNFGDQARPSKRR